MEEPTLLQIALEAADAGNAGHWPTVAGILADEYRKLERKNARLRKWIEELDEIARCTTPDRDWHGDIGWLYPGQVAYVGESRDDILSNGKLTASLPEDQP
jgi:hypothetical protein